MNREKKIKKLIYLLALLLTFAKYFFQHMQSPQRLDGTKIEQKKDGKNACVQKDSSSYIGN